MKGLCEQHDCTVLDTQALPAHHAQPMRSCLQYTPSLSSSGCCWQYYPAMFDPCGGVLLHPMSYAENQTSHITVQCFALKAFAGRMALQGSSARASTALVQGVRRPHTCLCGLHAATQAKA